MLRPVTLRRYLMMMRAKGFAAEDVLKGSGIDASRIDDENYLIEMVSLHRVVESMIRLTGDNGIGIDAGLEHQYSDFGILVFATLSGPNQLRNIEDLWNRHNVTVGLSTRLSVVKLDEQRLYVDIDVVATTEPAYRFFVEESLMLFTKVGPEMCNRPPPVPEKIEFSFPEPPYSGRYRSLFQCPISFGANRSRATFPSEWFEQPLKTSNRELRQFCEQRLEQLRQQISTACPTSLLLGSVLMKKRGVIPTLDVAAREMGVSSRTLSRQLQLEGTSYRKEIERYQTALVLDCIKSKQKTAKEISELAGFSDVNAFRRAFKRWTGITVREYRNANFP